MPEELLSYHDIDAQLERFEARWQQGDVPRIEEFLPPESAMVEGDPSRQRLLCELVMVDMERRWRGIHMPATSHAASHAISHLDDTVAMHLQPRQDPGPRLEDYLRRFPELGSTSNCPRELIANEYRVRTRWGDRPSQDQFRSRFPNHPELDDALNQYSATRAQPSIVSDYPQPFGDHVLLGEIARGGMGIVYKARHEPLDRLVALKVVLRGEFASAAELARFYAEAKTSANLDHPGIVPVYEVGEVDGRPFLAMQLIEGESLAQRVAGGPLPPRAAATLIAAVAEAMSYAHGHDVIHRDIKPANILMDDREQPRLTDFGLAKRVQDDRGLTLTGEIIGTPSFMAPEQARGDLSIGPAADIYAMGAVLYHLLTGRPPFQSANPVETIVQLLAEEPVAPRMLNADVPADLETICLKCLEKDPDRRYSSAHALQEDVQRFLEGRPIVARPLRAPARALRWAKRHRAVATLSGAIAGLLICGLLGTIAAYLMLRQSHQETVQALADAERLLRANQQLTEDVDRGTHTNQALTRELDEQRTEIDSIAQKNVALGEQTEQLVSDLELTKQQARDVAASKQKLEQQRLSERAAQVWQQYVTGIQTAQSALASGHRGEAQRALESCPVQHRDWEWYHLDLRCDSPIASVEEGFTLWDRLDHPAPIHAFVISPDSRRAATVGEDGIARLWDLAQGTLRAERKLSQQPLWAVTFLDEHRIAAAGKDPRVYVGTLEQESAFARLPASPSGTSVLHNSGGKLIAGSLDGSIQVLSGIRKRPVALSQSHTGAVRRLVSVTLKPSAHRGPMKVVVSLGREGRLLFHPLGNARVAARLTQWGQANAFADLQRHRDGILVSSGQANRFAATSLGLQDLTRMTMVPVPQKVKGHDENGKEVTHTIMKPMPKLVYTHSEVVGLPQVGKGPACEQFRVSVDQRWVATRRGSDITVHDPVGGEVLAVLPPHTDRVTQFGFSADSRLLLTASRDGQLRVWHVDAQPRRHAASLHHLAYGGPRSMLATASESDRLVKVWNGDSLVQRFAVADVVNDLQFDREGAHLAWSCGALGTVVVHALDSMRRLREDHVHQGAVRALQFDAAGRYLYSAGADGTVWSRSVGDSTPPQQVASTSEPVTALAMAPGGELIWATGSGQVNVQHVAATAPSLTLAVAPNVQMLRSHPAHSRLLTLHADGALFDWHLPLDDSAEQAEDGVRLARGHRITSAAYSPSGKRIFATTAEGSLLVLGRDTTVLTLAGNTPLRGLAVTPHGARLIAGGEDGKTHTWRARAANSPE